MEQGQDYLIQSEVGEKLWKELGDTKDKSAKEVICQAAEVIAPDLWKLKMDGKMKEVFEHGGPIISSQVPYGSPEAVWLLGREDEGVEILHQIVVDYQKGLLERANRGEKKIYDDELVTFANLAMIELAELHQKGKYSGEKMTEIVDLTGKIVDSAGKLVDPHFPLMWGLNYFWDEALKDKIAADKAWSVTEKATKNPIPRRHPHTVYLSELHMRLFKEGTGQTTISENLIEQFASFFVAQELSGESHADMNPDLLIRVVHKELALGREIKWNPRDVSKAFSQEGVASRMLSEMEESPREFFNLGFESLFKGISEVPASEYDRLTKEVARMKTEYKLVVSYYPGQQCFDVCKSESGDVSRYVEWLQFVAPDQLAQLEVGTGGRSEEMPGRLINLAQIYEEAKLPSSEPNVRKGGLWLPMIGEQYLDVLKGSSVSFAGDLIKEAENMAYANGVGENVRDLLLKIHQHLHYFEIGEASEYIEGIYACVNDQAEKVAGVSAAEVKALMVDPNLKAKFDLIRSQTNPEVSEERNKDRLQMGLNLSRTAIQENPKYRSDAIEELFNVLQKDLEDEFDPTIVVGIVQKLNEYKGRGKGYLLPILLAVRGYLLDTGVEPPQGVSIEEWRNTIVNVANMTGEVAPEAAYAWKRMGERVADTVRMQAKNDYGQIQKFQESLKNMGMDERNVQDVYRGITARSMVDLVYRLMSN